MKNPKIVVTDNRDQYYKKVRERLWLWGKEEQEIEWVKLEYNG